MSKRGCSIIGLVVAVLFIFGLIGGAIGRGLNITFLPKILNVPVLEVSSFFRGDVLFKAGPLPISNTLLASWVTIIVVVLFAFAATRKMKIIPGRLQALVESAAGDAIEFRRERGWP